MSSMQRRLRQALGAVKDQTSIGLARVSSNIGSPDLEVAIVKATSHDAVATDEKYVHEILFLVSNSPGSVRALAMGLAKRFDRTHNWTVALKGLMLIHRLLRGGDRNFEEELRESRSQGLLNLNLSNFRDSSSSSLASDSNRDFTAFLRSYSQFLDERMDWSITPAGKLENASGYGLAGEENFSANPVQEVKSAERKLLEMVLVRLPKSQALLDRVIACRPNGLARSNGLVRMALNSVVRESLQVYSNVCEGIASLIDTFFDMQYQHCGLALEIYKKAASQSHQLCLYFELCKDMNVCGSFEYPPVEKICQEHVDTLEEFMKNRFESKSVGFVTDEASAVAAPAKAEPDFMPRRKSFGCALRDFSCRDGNPRHAEYIDSRGDYKGRHSAFSSESAAPVSHRQKSGRPEQRNGGSGLEKPRNQEEENADLLQIEKPTASVEEHENRLALALFPGHSQTKISTKWENFNTSSDQQICASISGKDGWDFNTSHDQQTCQSISGKGDWNFNTNSDRQTGQPIPVWNFSTNSDQQTCQPISGKGDWSSNTSSDQESCKSISAKGCWNFNANSDQQAFKLTSPSGKPGWELALVSMSSPAKSDPSVGANKAAGRLDDLLLDSLYDHAEQSAKKSSSGTPTEDPFAASANIPPPAYVQMDEMKRKQSYLLQEQQLWQRYQSEGMHGYCGFVQLYNSPSCGPGSNTPNLMSYGPMPGSTMLPHYNMGGFAFY